MKIGDMVTVIKKNSLGEEVWSYPGKILECTENSILLEAFFNRPDLLFHGIVLAEGDRFLEVYFSNRWYNIFEIHDKQTDALKCWYCNVTSPTRFDVDVVDYRDLALDLLVYPDGNQLVLDEDEFADLELTEDEKTQALAALKALQTLFRQPAQVELRKLLEDS